MTNLPFIRTPRQERAIEALLANREITVKQLGSIIGALNPPQIIMELRRQGFEKIIQTRRFNLPDRDGLLCYPGAYFIPDELKSIAKQALEKYTTPAKAIAKVVKKQNHRNHKGRE